MKRLTLVLTSECNLRCDYCFENDKKSGSMDWPTLRAAIDLGLGNRHEEIEFSFFGGEPLLEFDLMRRAVEYAEQNRPASKSVRYGIITNGTLLDRARASFLAGHDFRTLLSFDGVPAAQELRGKGTFEKLDRTLDRLRADHPEYYGGIAVSITVTPDTVRHLADSVKYFLGKRVASINMSPVITHAGNWRMERIREIDEQFDRILTLALDEFRVSGEIPVGNLRGGQSEGGCENCDSTMCGVMRGETPAIDVDGQMHGCVMFAGSFQKWRTRFLRERVDHMSLGDFRRPELRERYARFPELVEDTEIFHHKSGKYSSYGRCGDCTYRLRCEMCPVSIGNLPGNDDAQRVPDFGCAFYLSSCRSADRFERESRPYRPISQPPMISAGTNRIRELARSVRMSEH